MNEIRTEVKTFKVDCICTKCLEGRMRPTGIVLESMPPQYVHECTICDHENYYLHNYPYIETEELPCIPQ